MNHLPTSQRGRPQSHARSRSQDLTTGAAVLQMCSWQHQALNGEGTGPGEWDEGIGMDARVRLGFARLPRPPGLQQHAALCDTGWGHCD